MLVVTAPSVTVTITAVTITAVSQIENDGGDNHGGVPDREYDGYRAGRHDALPRGDNLGSLRAGRHGR